MAASSYNYFRFGSRRLDAATVLENLLITCNTNSILVNSSRFATTIQLLLNAREFNTRFDLCVTGWP